MNAFKATFKPKDAFISCSEMTDLFLHMDASLSPL